MYCQCFQNILMRLDFYNVSDYTRHVSAYGLPDSEYLSSPSILNGFYVAVLTMVTMTSVSPQNHSLLQNSPITQVSLEPPRSAHSQIPTLG